MKQILAIQNRNERRRVIETKFLTVFQTSNRMKNYQTQTKFTVSITRLVLLFLFVSPTLYSIKQYVLKLCTNSEKVLYMKGDL